jgi:hypothetical protein
LTKALCNGFNPYAKYCLPELAKMVVMILQPPDKNKFELSLNSFHGVSHQQNVFGRWEPPEVSERMWSLKLDTSIQGEYQTL